MKKILCLILMLVLSVSSVVCFSGCSCAADGDEVSVLYYTYSDTYISGVRSQMDGFFKRAGIKYHNYDAGSNQTTQTEQVDTAITKGTSLLIVNIVDTGSDDAAKAIVEKAKNANIPLIFFNRSVSEEVLSLYDKCVFVGTDYEMAGKIQGQMIGEYLVDNYDEVDINRDGKISYVLFKGQQGNAEAEARTKFSVSVANEILTKAGKSPLVFYNPSNRDGYIVDQNGTWSNAAANNSMKTVLSAHSEAGGNMVELVIANNDEMALGALAALEEVGYNKQGARTIPVFGVDASAAAVSKIEAGAMTGTVKQDAVKMAETIVKIAGNMTSGLTHFEGVDETIIADTKRVNIPYSLYTIDSTAGD